MRVALAYLGRITPELEFLSAVLKQRGHEIVFAYDPGLFSANDNVFCIPRLERRFARTERLVRQLSDPGVEAIYFHVYSDTLAWARDIAARVRPVNPAPTLFGGRHPSLAPEAVAQLPEVDFAICGDPEETVCELLNALASGTSPLDVPGLYFRDGAEVVASPLRDPIADLDALPWPDKELFAGEFNPADDYVIHVGRGCPGRCTFCIEGTLHRRHEGKYFRRRSAALLLDELETNHERFGFRTVFIQDSVFFSPKNWVLEFLDGYRRRVGVPFRCYGQIRALDDEIARALKESGCYGVEFGFQTANDRIRREVLDRPETTEDAKRTFALCDRHGLRYDVDHMFGLPGETAQDFVDAARIYADLRYVNRVKVHHLVYFPGAPILEIAKGMGLATDDDRARAEAGEVGDIARAGSIERADARRHVDDWRNFYKLMPILGGRLAHRCIDRGWNRWFGRLPGLAVIALQLLVAVRGGDRRFWIYIRYYGVRLRRHRKVMAEPVKPLTAVPD